MPVPLGAKVKDAITGFTGVVVGTTTHLYGCIHVVVEGPSRDGKKGETEVFDEQRCEVLEQAVIQQGERAAPLYPLGSIVRDRVNGFQGMVIGHCQYLFGPRECVVEPTGLGDDGRPKHVARFEEPRLELVEAKAPPVSQDSEATTGGPSTRF